MNKLTLGISAIIIVCLIIPSSAFSQDNSGKRWKVGALPAVAFDSETGFRYGALAQIYDHGPNLELYPAYRHTYYAEWSHTTKGNDLKQLKYDSEYLTGSKGNRIS